MDTSTGSGMSFATRIAMCNTIANCIGRNLREKGTRACVEPKPAQTLTLNSCQSPKRSRIISWSQLCVCIICVTVAVEAQQTNGVASHAQSSAQKEVIGPALTALPQLSQKPLNQLQLGGFTAEGIAIQAAKTPNPLQLLNPTAPADYGPAEANVVRDPITRRVSGLKIFSLRF